ncbi:hypothetical protein HID58_035115, partial [Brassica napus]
MNGSTTMALKLPYDLEEEILARVPWKYFATLRCVCKLWNSLILEERLNKKNLSFHMHSYSGEHRFILKDTGPTISAVGIEEQKNVVDPPSLIVQDFTLIKARTCNPVRVYKTVHCDGLLLCETTWIKCGSDFHQRDDAYSLGYLSHCDYRILRFRCASNSRNRPSRVEVCEVASKTWKVIDNISFDWFLSVPLSILSLRGTPYCIGLREDHTAFVQSYDFYKERFQPIDDLPFSYDELNPIALEIYKGDRLSVLEQCHKTRKICIWVKHWLMLTSWTKLVVVDIPEFPLIYPRLALLSTNYYFDKNNRLVITCNDTDMKGLSIIRVINDREFQVIKANESTFQAWLGFQDFGSKTPVGFVGENVDSTNFTLIKTRTCSPIRVYKTVHSDGLLLCVMDNQLLVRNPLLKETTWIKCGSDFHQRDDAYSLGYLSHCDYRILRFRCASNSRNRPSRVEVCEVASKTWKVIDNISFDWFLSVPLSILSLRGTPYCIGLREDHTAFVQSYDFYKERFQPIDDLPFSYDELNPIALEIYKGDRLSVLEQCRKTRKICIWVKHWLMLTSWTKLGLSIIRVINDKDFQVIKADEGECATFLALLGFQGFRSKTQVGFAGKN